MKNRQSPILGSVLSSPAKHDPNKFSQKQRKEINVDQVNGPIRTIQSAINLANEDTEINIAPGLYKENLFINKPGLKLKPKAKQGLDVIILVQKGPAIQIQLEKGEKVYILGLKFMHTGFCDEQNDPLNIEKDLSQGEDLSPMKTMSKSFTVKMQKFKWSQQGQLNSQDLIQLQNTSQQHNISQCNNSQNSILPNQDLEEQFLLKFKINSQINCIILVSGGKVYLEDCLLSLNFIIRAFQEILPAIVLNSNKTELMINRCEIKGHKDHETIGIISKKANAIIKDCKIHNHIFGGMYVWATTKNYFKIINSLITYNTKVGIQCNGVDSQVLIEQNEIKYNKGIGVQIGIANKSQIIDNIFLENQEGIQIISSDPYIKGNTIDKNQLYGVHSIAYDGIRCDGKITNNISISQNKDCGILCSGNNNQTKIEKNVCIQYNRKAGIKISDYANVHIRSNQISKNLGQGILCVETSSGVIENNQINENIKANIALGGENSQNILIVENQIEMGRCEGIFIINGSAAWILRNVINKNNDGIISITSVPLVQNNQIQNNKNHGIMMLKDSRPQIEENTIEENEGVGIYIRDKSHGKIQNNTVKNNKIDLVQEKHHVLLDNLVQKNTILGEKRIPSNYKCNIF